MTTKIQKPAQCRYCSENFGIGRDAWHKWAQHVIKLVVLGNIAHKPGLRFAKAIIRDESRLNQKKDLPTRTPLTEQERINKESMFRELSGQVEPTDTICPHCHRTGHSYLPSEFVQSIHAWRIRGILVFMCNDCRNDKKE